MTYAELKANIASYMKRSDLTSVIPTFIELAESDIYADVRCQAMETSASITLTGETYSHPDGLIEVRRLLIGDDQYYYVTPEEYAQIVDTSERKFTSIGRTLYINGGESGDTGTLTYMATFTALANDSDTNWLTENAPEVYLWGALRHACIYTLDDAGQSRFATLYAGAVERLNKREAAARVEGPLWQRVQSWG